jgi:hypothetical protein
MRADTPAYLQHGVVRLTNREDGGALFIFVEQVTAVLALGEGGPTRIYVAGGGAFEVCGSAEVIWREVRIAQLLARKTEQRA